MGYQVTITRGDENSENGEISKNEWLEYVSSDPELRVEEEGDFPTVAWIRGHNKAQLMWEDIGVWSWSPENPTIEKMIEIALKLNANVIGEDGTVFKEVEDGFTETYPEIQLDGSTDNRPWWKKLFN